MTKHKKRVIKELVNDFSPWEFGSSLGNLLAKVQALVEVHGADAELDWNAHYYYPYESNPSPRYELYVKREESDFELEKRVAQERSEIAKRDAHEKAEFERLAKKYGATK